MSIFHYGPYSAQENDTLKFICLCVHQPLPYLVGVGKVVGGCVTSYMTYFAYKLMMMFQSTCIMPGGEFPKNKLCFFVTFAQK